jgi:hypothetical protein
LSWESAGTFPWAALCASAVPDDAPLEEDVPDAMDIVATTADAQSAAHGKVPADCASHSHTGNACDKITSLLLGCLAFEFLRGPSNVGSAVGKHDQGVPDDAPLEEDVPDAMDIVATTADP